jgi:hypothetical protein
MNMKLGSALQTWLGRANAAGPCRAASKSAERFRRPRMHLEQLEDRTVPSSPGDIEWVRQFGSLRPASGGGGRAVDADGNVYIAGQVGGALPGQTSAGGDDAFVRKYDAAGNEVWTRQFGTAFFLETANGIAVDASGVYVVGTTTGALPSQTSAGGEDVFVRKYDAAGNELWTRQFGGTPGPSGSVADRGFGVATDGSAVYVVGVTLGTLPGQAGPGDRVESFLRKYDSAGNEIWTRQFASTVSVEANAVAVGASGVYVGGLVHGSLPGSGAPDAISGDAFVRKYDVDGNVVWSRQFGSSQPPISLTPDEAVTGLAVDASGVYLAGYTDGTLPGQTRAGSTAGYDAFVRKYDDAGHILWTSQFGTSSSDQATSVSADPSGVYVAGFVGFGALPGQTSASGGDAFVRKYDASGTEVWTRQFGTAGGDSANGVAVDVSGIYLVGRTDGTFPGQTNTGGANTFVRKYDAVGSHVWTRQFGSFLAQQDLARAVDADGNVYVAGQVSGILPGQTSSDIVPDGADAFVRKYDAAGNVIWTRQFGTGGADAATSLAVDASGIYVAGSITGTLPGQTGSDDAFVRKYDAAGNVIWTRQFGANSDSATGVAADATGVYVAGFTNGTFAGQTSAGGVDAFVRKYNHSGTLVWTQQFGSAGADQANGIAANASGEVYVTGNTNGTLPGLTSSGGQDAFVRKYFFSGALVWTRQFGTAASDQATSIAADASGVSVSGSTAGTFAGQTSAGGQDAFLRRYDTAGADLWTRQFGSAGADQANGVAVGTSGIYVAGQTSGTLPGQTSAGGQDAFVGKFNASGTELWTRQFGTAASDSAAGVTVGASGLYAAGSTTGTFPNQTSAGLTDAFVAKIVDSAANTPPSNVSLNLNPSIDENGTATLTGSFTDPDAADTHTVVINWGPDEGSTTLNLAAGVATFSATHLYLDDNPTGTGSDVYAVSATVTEPAGDSASGITSVTMKNVAPVIAIIGPTSGSVYAVNTPITFTGAFTDAGTADTHTAQWTFDAVTVAGSVTQGAGSGTVSNSYTFSAPGVYSVRLTVTDDDGDAGTATTVAGLEALVVVYDPGAGFVTGGGWIDSPAGAYAADPTLTGRANFGFVSKYQKGATTPTGQTEFQFKAGSFNFHSSSYDWLVVAGARAIYKGTGTVNGAGNFGFQLTAIDGQVSGGGGVDKFRMKVWDKATDAIVYDNQMGTTDDADPATALGGGSILIHANGSPLKAAGGAAEGGSASVLTDGELRPIVEEAIRRWAAAGLDADRLAALGTVEVRTADLPGPFLGLAFASENTVRIDTDAAGYGWFVDSTPWEDSEFSLPGDQGEQGRMDLLSTVTHELGHMLGLDDLHGDAHADDLMGEELAAGSRRVPTAEEAAEVTGDVTTTHEAPAAGTVTLTTTQPAAGTVTLTSTPVLLWLAPATATPAIPQSSSDPAPAERTAPAVALPPDLRASANQEPAAGEWLLPPHTGGETVAESLWDIDLREEN